MAERDFGKIEKGLPIVNDSGFATYQLTNQEWQQLPKREKAMVSVNGRCRVRVRVFGPDDYQPVFLKDLEIKPILGEV
jgi:hypothetical protein